MEAPTAEQIAKLPKWAQEHIASLTRDLASAVTTLNQMGDSQTPSPFWVDDWYVNPPLRRYMQSSMNRMVVEHAGVHLEVYLAAQKDPQRDYGIELTYRSSLERVSSTFSPVALVPRGIAQVALVATGNLR